MSGVYLRGEEAGRRIGDGEREEARKEKGEGKGERERKRGKMNRRGGERAGGREGDRERQRHRDRGTNESPSWTDNTQEKQVLCIIAYRCHMYTLTKCVSLVLHTDISKSDFKTQEQYL